MRIEADPEMMESLSSTMKNQHEWDRGPIPASMLTHPRDDNGLCAGDTSVVRNEAGQHAAFYVGLGPHPASQPLILLPWRARSFLSVIRSR